MTKDEIKRKIDELGPWHYNHIIQGVSTGSSGKEEIHAKLVQLLQAGAFSRIMYPKVLDLGSNSGIISMWFVDHKLSIVDAIEHGTKYYPQLEFAIEHKGYTNKINPFNRDITVGGYGHNKYDLILHLGVLHHLGKDEAKQHTIKESLIALVPGGEIVIQTRSDLPVEMWMKEIGFLDVKRLDTNWHDRAAWSGIKDPMKV